MFSCLFGKVSLNINNDKYLRKVQWLWPNIDCQNQSWNFHTVKFPLCQHIFAVSLRQSVTFWGKKMNLMSALVRMLKVFVSLWFAATPSYWNQRSCSFLSNISSVFGYSHISHEPTCPSSRISFLMPEPTSNLSACATWSEMRTAGGTNNVAAWA